VISQTSPLVRAEPSWSSAGTHASWGMSRIAESYTQKLWIRVKRKAAYLPG